MKISETAGGIVLNSRQEILVVTNAATGRKTLPKGRLESGESHEQAAIREVLEEGGLKKVQLLRELGIIIRQGFTSDNLEAPSVIKHIRIYLFTTDEIDLNPIVDDIEGAEWVHQDDVTDTLSWPEEAVFFKAHRSELRV